MGQNPALTHDQFTIDSRRQQGDQMEHRSRGQAALEFLLTYSWAILVVIVIIGALAYFGVLNPKNFIPEKCTFGAGISCDDWAYSSTTHNITLRLTNGYGRGIQVKNITVTSNDFTSSANCHWVPASVSGNDSGPTSLDNGQQADYVFFGCPVQPGTDKMRMSVTFNYTYSGGIQSTQKSNKGDVFISTH